MNTAIDHIDKARHNLVTLAITGLDTDQHADWAIVVMFYAALHAARAALHARSVNHGTSHAQTQKGVDATFPQNMAQAYERLYSRSRAVRYEDLGATRNDYQRLRNQDFTPLKLANILGLVI